MEPKFKFTPKTINKVITFRPSKDAKILLQRAVKDHPIITAVINDCIRGHLTTLGYARKRELTTTEGK